MCDVGSDSLKMAGTKTIGMIGKPRHEIGSRAHASAHPKMGGKGRDVLGEHCDEIGRDPSVA